MRETIFFIVMIYYEIFSMASGLIVEGTSAVKVVEK